MNIKTNYESPELYFVLIKVERGFAESGGNLEDPTADPEEGWD